MQRSIIGFALSLALAASSAYAVEFQDFANDPTSDGWVGFNNTLGGNSYGWSAVTNNTNNDAGLGEGGGALVNADNPNNYYADVNLGGSFNLNNALSASGWFRFDIPSGVPNPTLHFGFFYKEAVELPQDNNNAIGFTLADDTNTSMRVGARVVDDGGSNLFSSFVVFPHATNHFFDFDYDPTAGANGVLTLTFDNDSNSGNGVLSTMTVNLTAGQRTTNATLNAFGLVNFENGLAPGYSIFFDDVTYTSNHIIPEPAGMTLLGIGFITMIAVKRRHNRSR